MSSKKKPKKASPLLKSPVEIIPADYEKKDDAAQRNELSDDQRNYDQLLEDLAPEESETE